MDQLGLLGENMLALETVKRIYFTLAMITELTTFPYGCVTVSTCNTSRSLSLDKSTS